MKKNWLLLFCLFFLLTSNLIFAGGSSEPAVNRMKVPEYKGGPIEPYEEITYADMILKLLRMGFDFGIKEEDIITINEDGYYEWSEWIFEREFESITNNVIKKIKYFLGYPEEHQGVDNNLRKQIGGVYYNNEPYASLPESLLRQIAVVSAYDENLFRKEIIPFQGGSMGGYFEVYNSIYNEVKIIKSGSFFGMGEEHYTCYFISRSCYFIYSYRVPYLYHSVGSKVEIEKVIANIVVYWNDEEEVSRWHMVPRIANGLMGRSGYSTEEIENMFNFNLVFR